MRRLLLVLCIIACTLQGHTQYAQTQFDHTQCDHTQSEHTQYEHTPCDVVQHEYVQEQGRGLLYECFLSQEQELDAYLVCKSIFPRMSPEQINDSVRDIQLFIEAYERAGVRATLAQQCKIGDFFLTNILHAYGHVITFIEEAWVNIKSKRVFVQKSNREFVPNSVPLMDYWLYLEQQGVKLHIDTFYASCIDYLLVMIGTQLSMPCRDVEHMSEVQDRWIYWMEKVARKLEDNETFGGYYAEQVKNFKEVFALWRSDFEKQEKMKRRTEDEHAI